MNVPPPPEPAVSVPLPRRTRSGAVIVGPTVRSRYLPGALIGLPMVSVLLSPFAGAALQQWRSTRLRAGPDGLLKQVLDPAWVQLLLGALLLWALFALWTLVPLLLTRSIVLFDERVGTLTRRKGLRTVDRASLAEVDHAVGEAERGGMGLIGIRRAGTTEMRQWMVSGIGWDSASFDGLRILQAAAGLRPAPPRPVLVRENRRVRVARANHELADRLGMPWRPEYEHDEAAFRAEFDRVRRVLGGKEPARDGDPRL